MNKLFTFGLAIFSATSLLAQTYEFGLNKALTVGCYNANPLTDMTKKVDVKIDGQTGTLTIASLNCKKEIVGISLGVVNESTQGTMYFDEKEKKGFIIEKGEKIILFNNEDNAYKVSVIGHIDKKLAKTLNSDSDQANYASAFEKIESILADAKKKGDSEKMKANTLPVPAGNYSDKFDISGTYYLSSNQKMRNQEKYIQAVNLQLNASETGMNIHFSDGANGIITATLHEMLVKKYKDGIVDPTVAFFDTDFSSDIDMFSRTRLYPLEKGLYYVTVSGCGSFGAKNDCSEPYVNEGTKVNGEIQFMLLGKDKERINYLMTHQEELIKLGKAAYVKQCEQFRSIYEADSPMPVPGLKDAKLTAEFTEIMKVKAATWNKTVVYTYIKSSEWNTIRNKATSIIVGRSMSVIAVMKTAAGKCVWEEEVFKQDFDGTSYGKSYFYGNTQIIVPVDCNAAMKYKL